MKTAMTMSWMLVFGALSAACAGQKIEPQVAPSATEANYATQYPAALQSVSNDYVNAEGDVRKNTTDFAKYPDQLKDPPWTVVQGIVARADEAGRGSSYVEGRHDFEAVQDFFTQENGEITRKVAGSAEYVVKKKDYDVDVSGAVASSLKDAVDKQQEKRLRAHNDAHVIIERYRESLGKANAAALEKQADDIAETSYLAFVRTIELKAQASRLLDETSQVRKTLDQSATEEHTFQAEPGRTTGDKKASNDRLAKLEDAKVRIDSAIPQLQALVKEIDQRNDAIKKEYENALENLKKAIAGKSASK